MYIIELNNNTICKLIIIILLLFTIILYSKYMEIFMEFSILYIQHTTSCVLNIFA